jgi:hypothetical protein
MSVPIVRTSPEPDIYTPGGPLSVTDPIYVSRTADRELLDAVSRGQLCFILTPRQMGKSSLMYRTAASVRSLGIRSVVVDLTGIGGEANADQWYLGHLTEIVTQLNLKTDYLAWWEKARHLSAVQRFGKFLTEVVLTEVAEPVIIFVDEIDTTLKLSYSDDYFAAIRSLYNRRAAEPELKRLTFVLLGVASPSDLIKDSARTPFNIGQRIHLTDFQLKEAQPLSAGLSPDAAFSQTLLDRILSWTGGHPYLTQTACKRVAEFTQSSGWDPKDSPQVVDQLIDKQFFSERGRHTDANLQFVTERILEHEAAVRMLRLYRRIRSGESVLDDELDPVRMTLKLSGLVKAGEGKVLQVRNRIYQRVFDDAWVRSELARRGESSQEEETGLRSFIPKFLRGGSRFKYDVFIANASRDAEWVREYLVPNLEHAGLTVFADSRTLSPGSSYSKQVESAIADSRSTILVISPALISSAYAIREMELAVRLADEDKQRLIIPLVLRKTEIPSALRDFHLANFTDQENWNRQMVRLFETLGAPNKVSPLEISGGTQTSTGPKDTGIIRQLLDSAFDDEELLTFAYDYFRPVYAEMEPGLSKRMRIQRLIESAERDNRLDYLLDQVARARPNEYRQFSTRFEIGPSAGTV